MSHKRLTAAMAALAMGIGLSACLHDDPEFIYMPDMVYSPAIKAQEEGSMRPPVPGTVPRGFQRYPYSKTQSADAVGKEFKNPLQPTHAVLERGQAMFNTYCIVCHGPNGEGDGTIVPRFPRPPSLQSDKVRNWVDGSIYHVVSAGQNLMPSYASQITSQDRWAIIHYVRVLQRSKHPTPEDVRKFEAANAQ